MEPGVRIGRACASLVIAWLAAWSVAARTQTPAAPPPEDVKARYTKYEYMVPMRDGVRLFTSIYAPKDTAQKYPFLLTRTPYSVAPYGVGMFVIALGPKSSSNLN